ncbi:type VI secretion system membrane subunit TssM [Spongorhabdus nitratireducens]
MTLLNIARRVGAVIVLLLMGAVIVIVGIWLPSQFQGYIGWLFSAVIMFISSMVGWVIWRLFKLEKKSQPKPEKKKSEDNDVTPESNELVGASIRSALDAVVKRLHENNPDVYGLPWFLMLGGKGTGKTTLLRYWGLVKIHTPVIDAADQYCQFWCSAEMLIIRIDGDLFETGRDQTGTSPWKQLLQRVVHHRPRYPLNGVICVEGMENLAASDPRLSEADAAYMGLRLGEISSVLNQRLPVWVLISGADKLMDFSSSFAAAHAGESEELFGGLVPGSGSAATPGFDSKWFASHWQELLHMLSTRALHMIQEDPRRENWASLVALPVQLQLVGKKLARFLNMVFSKHPLQAPVWFRGYFLLALGGEARHDPLGQNFSQRYNLLAPKMPGKDDQGQPLFSSQILEQVIVPEAWLAGHNRKKVRWWRIRRSFYWLLLTLLLGVGALWAVLNIRYENQLRHQLLQAVTEWDESAEAMCTAGGHDSTVTVKHATLDSILESLEQLREIELRLHQDDPWYVVIWPDLARSEPVAERTWLAARRHLLLPKLDDLLKEQLKQALDSQQRSAIFEWLELYLMFHSPSPSELEILQTRLVSLVLRQSLLSENSTLALKRQLSELKAMHLQRSVDEGLVDKARRQINNIRADKLGLLLLEQQPAFGARATAGDLLGRDFYAFFRLQKNADTDSSTIPVLFTRDGFSRLDLAANSELVTGLYNDIRRVKGITEPASAQEKADFAARLRQAYAETYIREWQTLLNQVTLAQVSDLSDALRMLTLLQRPVASPLLMLVNNVAEGTRLVLDEQEQGDSDESAVPGELEQKALKTAAKKAKVKIPAGSLGKARDLGTPIAHNRLTESVASAFYGWQLLATAGGSEANAINQVIAAAGVLQKALQQAVATGDTRQALHGMALEHVQGAGPLYSLTTAAAALPDPCGRWITELVSQVWLLMFQGAHDWIAQQWHEKVVSVYQQTLEGRFPFQPNSDRDAGLTDFATFFAPKGVLSGFMKSYLNPFLDLSRDGSPRIIGGHSITFRPELKQVIHSANQIRNVFFNGDAGTLGLLIRLQARDLSSNVTELRLSSAQSVYRYQHGPRIWQEVTWPGADPGHSVELAFYNGKLLLARQQFYGAWAMLRMLYAGGLRPLPGNDLSAYEARLQLKDYKARLWFELPGVHESMGRIFTHFKLPESI